MQQIIADCANPANVPGPSFAFDLGCSAGAAADALLFASTYSLPLSALYKDVSVLRGNATATSACNRSTMALPWPSGSWVQSSGFWSPAVMSQSNLMAAVAVQPMLVLLRVGMEFLSWSSAFAKINSLNWNGGIFTPFQVCRWLVCVCVCMQ